MWQIEVPMIMTMRPVLGHGGGRHGDVGIDVRDRHGRPGRRPVQPAASGVRPPARAPIGEMSRVIRVSTTSANRGSSAPR